MEFQKSLFQSLLWRGLLFVVVLILNVVISRNLGAAAAGEVFYYSTVYAFIVLIAGICLETGLGYYLSSKPQYARSFAVTAFLYSFIIAAVLYLVVVAIPFNMTQSFFTRNQIIVFGLMYVSGIMLSNLFTALFHARQNFFLANFLLAATNVILVVLLLYFSESVSAILNLYFVFFLLQGLVLFVAFYLKYARGAHFVKPGRSVYKKVFKYSAAALLGNIIFFLVYRIDYYFVERYVAEKDLLGNYIQASKMGQLLLIVPNILATAIFPQTASGNARAEINQSLQIISRLFMQAYLVLFIVFLFFGKLIFTTVFGATFSTMNIAFLVLLPGIFALSVLTILSSYFAGKGKLKINVIGAAIALVFVVVFDLILIPRYGIVGAAIVSTAGYCLNLLYSLAMFYKDYRINLMAFFGFRKADYQWLLQLMSQPKNRL